MSWKRMTSSPSNPCPARKNTTTKPAAMSAPSSGRVRPDVPSSNRQCLMAGDRDLGCGDDMRPRDHRGTRLRAALSRHVEEMGLKPVPRHRTARLYPLPLPAAVPVGLVRQRRLARALPVARRNGARRRSAVGCDGARPLVALRPRHDRPPLADLLRPSALLPCARRAHLCGLRARASLRLRRLPDLDARVLHGGMSLAARAGTLGLG